VVSRIQREAKAQAGLYYPRPARLPHIQRALSSTETLVVYGSCVGESIAVVVTKRSARLVMLGKAAPIDKACLAFREMSDTVDLSAAIATLKKTLVAPLEVSDGMKRVILSPSGPLSYVPTASLFKQTTSLIPSATTLVLLRSESSKRGAGVLALGDPTYDKAITTATAVYQRGGPLARLPETRLEVEEIGDVKLLGDEASEAEFRRALAKRPRWRSVHFACHGFVDQDNPVLCALALTPTEEDDGFLTVLDVFRQVIPADLAVLSACETGAGAVVRGDGLHGLVRGFMYAGSPRVIASLWKVDDKATKALMLKFYELWNPKSGKGGRSAAEALEAAQKHVRSQKKWEHPYFWAAWVLWGLPE
jgi:CHAT domain-containing protein